MSKTPIILQATTFCSTAVVFSTVLLQLKNLPKI